MKALLVIDVQREYMARYDISLLRRINQRIQYAIDKQELIIYVRNVRVLRNSKETYEFAENLNICSQYVIMKKKASAFSNSELLKILQQNSVSDIEMIGVDGNYCVASSARDAAKLGYNTCLSVEYIGVQNEGRFAMTCKDLKERGISIQRGNNMDLKIIKDYRENETIRHSFNKLAMEIFGIDFESWYQHGFWTERYKPYSVLLDGEVVANVSVNRMTMRTPEKEYHVMQLGTVMTYEQYRNRGYIRMLMEEIDKDYAGQTDGFYLFASDSVLEFYPKFGFEPAEEFQTVREKEADGHMVTGGLDKKAFTAQKVPMETREDWDRLVKCIEKSVPNSRFEMMDNAQLAMFYLSSFMKDNVYYVADEDAYVVAEIADSELFLTAVYADHVVDLDKIRNAFGDGFSEVRLGFIPLSEDGYAVLPYKQEDCTLFLKGNCWKEYRQDKLRFPELSHA